MPPTQPISLCRRCIHHLMWTLAVGPREQHSKLTPPVPVLMTSSQDLTKYERSNGTANSLDPNQWRRDLLWCLTIEFALFGATRKPATLRHTCPSLLCGTPLVQGVHSCGLTYAVINFPGSVALPATNCVCFAEFEANPLNAYFRV